MMKFCAAGIVGFALLLGGGFSFGQDGEDDEERSEKRKELPYVDVFVIPVGPVPLARFGKVKSPPKPQNGKQAGDQGSSEGASPKENEKALPSGPKGFVVLQRDASEYPPRALYLKQGDKFAVLPCAQNSIGTPVRVPLKSSNLEFYERQVNSEGKHVYKKYHSHRWNPEQKRLLVTITKPLASKYWTKPQIKIYDLSPELVKGKPLLVVNAGQERVVGLTMGGQAKRLKPFAKTSLSSDKEVLSFKMGVLTKTNKLHAPQQLTVPNRRNEQMLILAFPCSSEESFRGLKMIRGRIMPDQYRKVDLLDTKRGA
ncbi:hypothetical protein HW115_16020 [Verrucomicrobiaceae bacterium N1E253]|uniref:Uncharacterized protein n=1 Tax=Oceaniferula marina TaxID=2748318 RepID=A0A851GIX4_9BACT|nr:hypothetical protein [Oceaniferula marina]NWK57129.1 hypothetical protein [Oceaniferula marina]